MADVLIRFKGDTSDVKKDIAGIKKESKGLGSAFASAGGALKTAFAGAGVAAAIKFASSAVTSFTNLEESLNAVNVQFGEGADIIKTFGETAADSVGLANSEFNQLATVTGATLSAFIDDEKEVADATIELTQRAADMASVFNTDVSEAMTALGAAVRGESEPIRRFGVQLDDASVKARAVELGLAASTAEVDLQAKGMARLDLIYEQTNKTAGDFANTSDSIANRMKTLSAKAEDAKVAIGKALVPAVEELLDLVERGIPLIEAFGDTVSQISFLVFGREQEELNTILERTVQLMEEGLPFYEAQAQAEQEVADAAKDAAVSVEEARIIFGLAADTANGLAAADDALVTSYGKVESAADKAAAAVNSVADAQRKQVDPLFALKDAQEKVKDAEDKVTQLRVEGKKGTKEYTDAATDLVDATGDLLYAEEIYNANAGDINDMFRIHAEKAGFAADETERFIRALETAGGTPFSPSGDYGPGPPRHEGLTGGVLEGLDFQQPAGAPIVINMNVDATGNTDPDTLVRESAIAMDRELALLRDGQRRRP